MAKQNRLFKSTVIVTLIIVLSKIAGMVREMFMAAQFGQGIEKSAYGAAYSIITIFTIFFTMGISTSFIPIYTKIRLERGEKAANEYTSCVMNLYILLALLTTLLGTIFSAQLTSLVWDGTTEGFELTNQMTRLMMPSLVFWAVAGVLVNLLNARKHFVPEQLMGFALSFCVILACVLFDRIEMVAIATSISAVMQIVILAPFLRKRFSYSLKLNLKDKDIRQTFRLAIPGFISAGFDELNAIVDTRFASAMGDHVPSVMNESLRLGQPILGVLIVPITTVMYTQLSGYAAKKEMGEFKKTVRTSIEIIALITIPIIVMGFLLQTDIVSVFLERGAYTSEATLNTAPVFGFYIVGLIGYGLRSFLARAFYSLKKARIPMIVGIAAVGINIALDFLLKDPLGARGLTLATSIASICAAAMMLIVLRRNIGFMGLKKTAGQVARILISAAVCAVFVMLLLRVLPIAGEGFLNRLARVLICGLGGLTVYGLMAMLLKVETTGKLIGMLKGKLRRKKA